MRSHPAFNSIPLPLKPYLIYSLTDETYSLVCTSKDKNYNFWVSLLDHSYWVTGSVLGEVGGLVESDGKSCNLTLNAEKPETCKLIERRRRDLRKELQGLELPVVFIGISRKAVEHERDLLLAGRGLDITV